MRISIKKIIQYVYSVKDLLLYYSERIVPTVTILLFAVFGCLFYRHGYDIDSFQNTFKWIFACLILCTFMPWNLTAKRSVKTEEDKQIGVTAVICKIILIGEYLVVIFFL